jgi:hypothetical protein
VIGAENIFAPKTKLKKFAEDANKRRLEKLRQKNGKSLLQKAQFNHWPGISMPDVRERAKVGRRSSGVDLRGGGTAERFIRLAREI